MVLERLASAGHQTRCRLAGWMLGIAISRLGHEEGLVDTMTFARRIAGGLLMNCAGSAIHAINGGIMRQRQPLDRDARSFSDAGKAKGLTPSPRVQRRRVPTHAASRRRATASTRPLKIGQEEPDKQQR